MGSFRVILFNVSLSGGAGKAMINLSKAFTKNGIETHIISFKKSQYEIPKEIDFHLLLSSKNATEELKKLLSSIGDFNVIFSNSTPSNKILSKLKLKNSFHIVHSAEIKNYRGFLSPFKFWLRRKKYQKLYSNKNLITVSKGLEDFILNDIGAKPKTIQTIYNIIDIQEIVKLSKENNLNIPKEPFIIHVGRYDITSKRHDILLKAYKLSALPYKLYLIGNGNDKEKIERIIKDLNLEDRVILNGFSSNPYSWMKRAKLLVLSSDFEGFGLVLAEALILGTPVVSTNCKVGPKEILKGNLGTFLVPVGDIDSLSEKMIKALENYPKIDSVNFDYLDFNSVIKKYFDLIEESSKC